MWRSGSSRSCMASTSPPCGRRTAAGGLDQRTIAEDAALDKSTCGDLVDRLARRGLVEAGIDPGNRRRKIVRITDAGRQRLEEAAPQQREVHRAALAELSDAERAELNRLLLKMLRLEA